MKVKLSVLVIILLMPFSIEAGETFNEHLPEWINVDLQLRHRFEWRSDFDFNEAVDDEKGFHLWRTRLNVLLKPVDEMKLFYQFQDSRISHDSISGAKSGFEDHAETRQLWLQAKTDKLSIDEIGLSAMGLKFGRQEFSYGAQRLLGGFNWSNVAQTFDGGKILFDFEAKDLAFEVFRGGKTPNKSPSEADDFYSGDSNDRIAGYYVTYKGIENTLIEQYLINRDTEGKTVSYGQTGDGAVDDYTIGARIKGKIADSRWDYELEAARQFGDSGTLDVSAGMVVAILGYTFDHDWKPRLSFEFDYATGDDNSTDGDRETFDNLQPTNHLFYGYMDFASLQNINNYHFQIKTQPLNDLTVQTDLHLIYLDESTDNLYSAGRGVKRAGAAGADEHVGNEIDLLAKYKFNKYVSFLAGYSHFFAGDFLEDTGKADDADFVYFQTMINF